MLQIAPLLAALDCPMKILKLLEPLIDVIKAVPAAPADRRRRCTKFVEAAVETSRRASSRSREHARSWSWTCCGLIRAVLNCLLGQLQSLRDLMNGLSLRLGEAEGNADLLAQLECAQENAAASGADARRSRSTRSPASSRSSARCWRSPGMELESSSRPGGAPPETTEDLDAIIAVARHAAGVVDAIDGE